MKLRRIGVQGIFARDSELGERFFTQSFIVVYSSTIKFRLDTPDKHFLIFSPLKMVSLTLGKDEVFSQIWKISFINY